MKIAREAPVAADGAAAVADADESNETERDDEDVWYPPDGLSGLIGETPLVAVDVSGDGLMGNRFVGNVTEREERLRESDERSIRLSGRPWLGV